MRPGDEERPPPMTDWAMFGGVCGILLMPYFKWIVDHSSQILNGTLF